MSRDIDAFDIRAAGGALIADFDGVLLAQTTVALDAVTAAKTGALDSITVSLAAAEIAIDDAVVAGQLTLSAASSARVFDTRTDFAAALDANEFGWIILPYGNGVVSYKKVGGAAVSQNSFMGYGDTSVRLRGSLAMEQLPLMVQQMPVTPLFRHVASDGIFSNGRFVPNRQAAIQPSKNWMLYPSGSIPNSTSGPTVTLNSNVGPTGTAGESQLIDFTTNTQVFQFFRNVPLKNDVPYKTSMFVRAQAGTGPWDIRHGYDTTGLVSVLNITSAAWVEVNYTRTPATALENYSLRGSGANQPKLEVAWFQIQEDDGAAFPTFNTEWAARPINYHLRPAFDYTGSLGLRGTQLEMTGGIAMSQIRSPLYPAADAVTDFGVFALVRVDSVSASADTFLCHPTPSLWSLGVTVDGGVYTLPIQGDYQNRIRMQGQGLRNIGITLQAAGVSRAGKLYKRAVWYEGHRIYEDITAFASLDISYLLSGGSSVLTSPNGALIDQVAVKNVGVSLFDKVPGIVKSMRDRAALVGLDVSTNKYVGICIGDSNFAAINDPSGGTSLGYKLGDDARFSPLPNLPMRCVAQSGYNMTFFLTRKAEWLDMTASIVAAGKIPIIFFMNSYVNYRTQYEASPSTVVNDMWTFTDSFRALGAKIVICTPTPMRVDTGLATAGQEAARQTAMGLMRAATTKWDALADIGGDAIMGNPATYVTAGTYTYDDKHYNQTGQDIGLALAQAAAATIMI